MNTKQKKKVKAKRVSATPKQCTHCYKEFEQEQTKEFERILRLDRTSNIFVIVLLVGLLIFSIVASIIHMVTVNMTMGLASLILMPVVISILLYAVIKITNCSFSDI